MISVHLHLWLLYNDIRSTYEHKIVHKKLVLKQNLFDGKNAFKQAIGKKIIGNTQKPKTPLAVRQAS